jgi:hypothetical protein
VTQDLKLKHDAGKLVLNDEERGGRDVVVGDVSGDLVHLCSGKYASACELHVVKSENRLVVGLSEAEFRNYEPDADASYETLFEVANYGLKYSLGAGIFADFKFVIGGKDTNPLRMAVKPVDGAIVYRGQEIGNYQKLAFCTGDYASKCRVLYNKAENNVAIFFKAKAP